MRGSGAEDHGFTHRLPGPWCVNLRFAENHAPYGSAMIHREVRFDAPVSRRVAATRPPPTSPVHSSDGLSRVQPWTAWVAPALWLGLSRVGRGSPRHPQSDVGRATERIMAG